jgi:hypothetical protein
MDHSKDVNGPEIIKLGKYLISLAGREVFASRGGSGALCFQKLDGVKGSSSISPSDTPLTTTQSATFTMQSITSSSHEIIMCFLFFSNAEKLSKQFFTMTKQTDGDEIIELAV